MKSICVYCGSNAGGDPAYAALAASLGARLAAEKLAIVYGGGDVGLMGIVADAALAHGGEVIGVIPQQLVDWEVAHTGVTRLEVVDRCTNARRGCSTCRTVSSPCPAVSARSTRCSRCSPGASSASVTSPALSST
jgi:uncharacterized protein (TIGR00730 family)